MPAAPAPAGFHVVLIALADGRILRYGIRGQQHQLPAFHLRFGKPRFHTGQPSADFPYLLLGRFTLCRFPLPQQRFNFFGKRISPRPQLFGLLALPAPEVIPFQQLIKRKINLFHLAVCLTSSVFSLIHTMSSITVRPFVKYKNALIHGTRSVSSRCHSRLIEPSLKQLSFDPLWSSR